MELKLQSIGKRLKEIRKKQGKTQEEFSIACGVSKPFIAKIEAGIQQPSASALYSLCIKCGISVDWLLTGKGQMFMDDNQFLVSIPEEYIELFKVILSFKEEDRIELLELFTKQVRLLVRNEEKSKEH